MEGAAQRGWSDLQPGEKWAAWSRWSQDVQLKVWPQIPSSDRLMILKRMGAAPEVCGSDIRGSVAQGRLTAFMPMAVVQTDAGNYRTVEAGYKGRAAARVADAFDRMEARRPKAARAVPLFDATQVAIARDYATLFEKVDAGAVKGSSLEARTDGSGGDRDAFIQGRLDDQARLRAMQRRIGDGVALQVRRVRPSDRGSRRSVSDRMLVDRICLGGCTIDDVLTDLGWKKDCRVRNVLRSSLASSLDRMAKRY